MARKKRTVAERLTAEHIIRMMKGTPRQQIAKELGVTESAIRAAMKGIQLKDHKDLGETVLPTPWHQERNRELPDLLFSRPMNKARYINAMILERLGKLIEDPEIPLTVDDMDMIADLTKKCRREEQDMRNILEGIEDGQEEQKDPDVIECDWEITEGPKE